MRAGELAAAQGLIERHDLSYGPLPRLRDARALLQQGRLELATRHLRDGLNGGHRRFRDSDLEQRYRAILERSASQLSVLTGGWVDDGPAPRPLERQTGRILHLVGAHPLGPASGYTVRSRETAAALARAGFDVHVVPQLRAGSGSAISAETTAVTYHQLNPRIDVPARDDERLALNLKLVAALAEQIRPTLLHAHSDHANARLALEVGRRFGLPVVYEVRGFREEAWLAQGSGRTREQDGYRLRRSAELACAARADRVVTLADVMRDHLVENGIARDRIAVVPNGVDSERFRPGDRDQALAATLGLQGAQLVAGYVGRLTAYEGLEHLLEALAVLAANGRRVHGLIVGDGPAAASLRERAEQLGVTDRVLFCGPVPHRQVERYLGLIDAFVLPRPDLELCRLVTPLKPLEAMAAGKVVIHSNLPALREVCGSDGAALAFAPGDAQGLADQLGRLADDPELRERIAAHARRRAQSRTWALNAGLYREIYGPLL